MLLSKIDQDTNYTHSIWGDPGGDVYVSPGEPGFWLHHGQLDRHWWMWANYLSDQVKSRTSMYEGKLFFLTLLTPSKSGR